MRLQPDFQQHSQSADRQHRRSSAIYASVGATVLSASGAMTLLPPATANAQFYDNLQDTPELVQTTVAEVALTSRTTGLATETVLLSTVPTPNLSTATATLGLQSPAATNLPSIATPAASLFPQAQELTQTVNATAPVSDGSGAAESYEPFWPKGYWGNDYGSSGAIGYLGTGMSLTGVGLGYLLWRSLGTAPEFESFLMNPDFNKELTTFQEGLKGSAAFVAKAKGDGIEYSIVESLTDDSALLTIDKDTGEVRFISDPQVLSPGDLNRDGKYHFQVKAENSFGSDTQAVELQIKANGFSTLVHQDSFVQHGGSIWADKIELLPGTGLVSTSLENVSVGSGNDYVFFDGINLDGSVVGPVTGDLGVNLGDGHDTFAIGNASKPSTPSANATGIPRSIDLDLGEGRDTVLLGFAIENLVITGFDADDIILFSQKTPSNANSGITQFLANPEPGAVFFDNELDALFDMGHAKAYQNGEDSYLVWEYDTDKHATVKFEDTLLTDFSQFFWDYGAPVLA